MILAILAFTATVALAPMAFAADSGSTNSIPDVNALFQQLTNSPVYEAECTGLCHGNIANTTNYSSSIIFTHGNHIMMQCSDCHTKFPHRQSGTVRPTMKTCFACHGVRHGPRGILATDVCEKCHKTPRWQMSCPYSTTTTDWAGVGHVKLGETTVNSDCMMCHKPADCTSCHDRTNVVWSPKNGWDFDPGESTPKSGCLACHDNSTLLKTVGGSTESYQVTGVQDSVHRDLTCQQCHPDYRYNDKPAYTKLWNVNAGIQCGVCHQTLTTEKDRVVVDQYNNSVHAQQILQGNYDAATCGSCHGGHFIYSLDTSAAQSAMHASAYRVCARCKQHGNDYSTYNDYYHGRAYKKGAPDAPACWDCHQAHDILPKADPKSSVYPANLGTTCGQPGCHKGSTQQFGAAAGQLIHQKVTVQQQNPVLQFISNLKGMIGL